VIERLGSNESIPIDVRIIASTKESLQTAFEQGNFEEDLFYHLNVIRIGLPPLREHREDIPILFRHFVFQACARYQLAIPLMTDEIFKELLRRDWPGNIRELPCRDNQRVSVGTNGQVNGDERTLAEKMDAFEKTLIAQELTRTKGNVKETYLTLGLPRKTFYDKLNKHSLKRKDFVGPDEPSNNGSSFHG
jgi:two-component system C4-dicarboxylate transport response regulator DctD